MKNYHVCARWGRERSLEWTLLQSTSQVHLPLPIGKGTDPEGNLVVRDGHDTCDQPQNPDQSDKVYKDRNKSPRLWAQKPPPWCH